MGPLFLTLDEVLALHEDQVLRYGGSGGLRDAGRLCSALGAVAATFGGKFLNETLFEMAAAYLVHLARNHPLIGGNERTALAAALTFLWLNDVEIEADDDELAGLVLTVARGSTTKAEAAVFFQRHARS